MIELIFKAILLYAKIVKNASQNQSFIKNNSCDIYYGDGHLLYLIV